MVSSSPSSMRHRNRERTKFKFALFKRLQKKGFLPESSYSSPSSSTENGFDSAGSSKNGFVSSRSSPSFWWSLLFPGFGFVGDLAPKTDLKWM